MLFDLVDTLQENRRLVFVALFVIADFWLLTLCIHTLQTQRANITARIHTVESYQGSSAYQSDTFDISSMSASANHIAGVLEVDVLRGVVAVTDGITTGEHDLLTAEKATLHTVGAATTATLRAAGHGVIFTGQVVSFPSRLMSRSAAYVFRNGSELAGSHLVSAIQPKQNITIPVITPEQAQQASLIQSGTLDFEPVKTIDFGGACDVGAGNGGYPLDWCDAPMDTVQTVPYSSDRINRECTSYAYWYFTVVEGHADLHVTGNANRWAYTSNYPTHQTPAVGSIAVETAGAYGHVAIVQALAGQTFDGKVVPAGYVLVSEMNYDWYGHFRYSYSPLGKFSTYIYP